MLADSNWGWGDIVFIWKHCFNYLHSGNNSSKTYFMPNFNILASLCSLMDLRVNIGTENVQAYFPLFQSPESRSSFHIGCWAPWSPSLRQRHPSDQHRHIKWCIIRSAAQSSTCTIICLLSHKEEKIRFQNCKFKVQKLDRIVSLKCKNWT